MIAWFAGGPDSHRNLVIDVAPLTLRFKGVEYHQKIGPVNMPDPTRTYYIYVPSSLSPEERTAAVRELTERENLPYPEN